MSDERARLVTDLAALRRQADTLEKRLAAARRAGWWSPILFLALGIGLGSVGVSWRQAETLAQESTGPLPKPAVPPAGQPGKPGDIVCSSIKIVGPDGKERVSIGYDTISGFIKIHGPDGKLRAALWTDDQSKFGMLSLLDENLKSRVVLTGNNDGGGCTVYGKDGKSHTYLGSALNRDAGILNVFGSQGKAVVQAGHDEEGGYVWVNGHDGTGRASLWVAKGGATGLLNLHDAAGKNRTTLGVDQHGGTLGLYGSNDNVQAILDCHNQWGGALQLYTPQKSPLVYLGANSNNGHGLFKLYGTDGQARIEMFVDNNGVGAVQGINAQNQVIRSLK